MVMSNMNERIKVIYEDMKERKLSGEGKKYSHAAFARDMNVSTEVVENAFHGKKLQEKSVRNIAIRSISFSAEWIKYGKENCKPYKKMYNNIEVVKLYNWLIANQPGVRDEEDFGDMTLHSPLYIRCLLDGKVELHPSMMDRMRKRFPQFYYKTNFHDKEESNIKVLEGENEVVEIIQRCKWGGEECNLEWKDATVSEFIESHEELKKYNTKQIGAVLNELGIAQENKRINGGYGRYRNLPMHKGFNSDVEKILEAEKEKKQEKNIEIEGNDEMKNIENMNASEIKAVIEAVKEDMEMLDGKAVFLGRKESNLLREKNKAWMENREENTSVVESYAKTKEEIIIDVKSIVRFLREVTE